MHGNASPETSPENVVTFDEDVFKFEHFLRRISVQLSEVVFLCSTNTKFRTQYIKINIRHGIANMRSNPMLNKIN